VRILIVSATEAEVTDIVDAIRPGAGGEARHRAGHIAAHEVDVLVTGVGMMATACWCGRTLARGHYELALNLGLCGTFDRALPLGTVVHVVSDRLSELGAEDGHRFLTVQELGLADPDEPPFIAGAIVNVNRPQNRALEHLPQVSGITVNTVHGSDSTIEAVTRRLRPQVESMEGAAFMYSCAVAGVPYAQVRAISNLVERRNRAAWQTGPAIAALGAAALAILESA
jgi:futalosine hydrolase